MDMNIMRIMFEISTLHLVIKILVCREKFLREPFPQISCPWKKCLTGNLSLVADSNLWCVLLVNGRYIGDYSNIYHGNIDINWEYVYDIASVRKWLQFRK